MLHLELPHVNVLSKIDLVKSYGDLGTPLLLMQPFLITHISVSEDFNLDFYTEVQDLSYLENALSTASPRFSALNMAMISLIEDYSLVGFETLAVEVLFHYLILRLPSLNLHQDKNSMLHLTRAIDRATGYIFVPPPTSQKPEGTVNDTSAPSAIRANSYALFSSAAGPLKDPGSDVRDIQERWIDSREEYDAFEKVQWRKEGETIRDEVARRSNIRERK